MMLNQEHAQTKEPGPIGKLPETVVIETKFGIYEFTPESTIAMPQGLVGFAEHRVFGLANLPVPVPEGFKLLQSLGEPPISFIVMPLPGKEAPIAQDDLDAACSAVGFDPEDIHCLFVCTIQPRACGEGIDISANLRAPILFNHRVRQARQYVLPDGRYPTRQPLDNWNGDL